MAAKARGFQEFGAVFGEAKPESDDSTVARPALYFCAHSPAGDHYSRLRVVATDFHSLAWDRSLSVAELDDLRDDVGIGGSWAEFVDYLKSSLSVGDVKLLLGPAHAKLTATKAKGLPRITISLNTVTGSDSNDAIANFSLALYTAYRSTQENASREQKRASQLMESLSSEREKNEILQRQLEALSFLDKRKATKPKLVADQLPSVSSAMPSSDQVVVSEQQQPSVASPSEVSPAKATKRVAPVPRRTRIRGALLQDTED